MTPYNFYGMATKTSVNDLIVCPICYEIFQDPKSLPQCLHTFCKSCIKSYISSSVTDKSLNKTDFYCPVCRKCYHVTNPEEWVDTLPHNHLIVSLTDQEKMEKKEPSCDCCSRLGQSQPAVSWCPKCCDQLCENCVNFHKISRLTMEHKLGNIAERDQNLSVDLFCKQHTSRRLEVYCFDHEEACCLMCATVSHRKCEKVTSLEDCAQNCSADIPNICSEIEDMQKACDTEITRVTSDLKSLETESKDIEHKVSTMAEEIINAVRDKEQILIGNLKKTEKEQSMIVQNILDEFSDVKKKIEHDVNILKNSDKLPKIALFLELKRIGKTVSEAKTDFNKLQKGYQTSDLEVHIDETVQKFHSSFDTFGEIKVKGQNKVNYQSGQLELEISVIVDGNTYLTDVDVIDECCIITTCQNKNMVYILDDKGKQLSSSKLTGTPCGIAALQNKIFCVALRGPGAVCMFKVHENLSISIVKELKMPQNAWGICAIEDRIVISVERPQGNAGQVFRFYDQEGNYCKEHTITPGSSNCGAVLATSNKCLFYTHHGGNSLFSVDISKSKSASAVHQGNNVKKPVGVTCDPNGNVYVACYGSKNVLQFDKNGNFIREIIQEESAVHSLFGIRVKRLGGDVKLILSTYETLLIYHFMQ
ncbi:E3 ubiquitin-protein ligase Midline-1-like [Crassostrea angulata]|uniref:E3 ubiquitin-protein ligase Midline-1-like n=1 Tax=Magallana angulata TaxID=2784310 RepID=UPI0022B150CF|nr:E3 ubiquitin-protein ligase Midline-1-like [Crassostrea angulata]